MGKKDFRRRKKFVALENHNVWQKPKSGKFSKDIREKFRSILKEKGNLLSVKQKLQRKNIGSSGKFRRFKGITEAPRPDELEELRCDREMLRCGEKRLIRRDCTREKLETVQ